MPPPSATADAFELEAHTDAFRATFLWEKIVLHLERTVKCGRHSQGLRMYDSCFPGSKAVDCLTVYLNIILPKTIKRTQASVLCQKLLLTGVIDDVRSKDKDRSVFRENKLYRFTGNHFWGVGVGDGASSRVSEKVGMSSKSFSSEHVLQDSSNSTEQGIPTQQLHPKGREYASDSTLASLPTFTTAAGKERYKIATASVSARDHDTATKGAHFAQPRAPHHASTKTSTARDFTMSVQVAPSSFLSSSKRISQEKSSRKAGRPSEGRKVARTTTFRKDKPKLSRYPEEPPPYRYSRAAASAKENDKRVSVLMSAASARETDKRLSLQMRNSRKARERDFALSYRHDVRQRMIVPSKGQGTGCMHRSHSFSSSSAGSACATGEGRKWVVYGFV